MEDLSSTISDLFQLESPNINVYSLAADTVRKTATVSFDEEPSLLKDKIDELEKNEVVFPCYCSTQRIRIGSLKFDTHFRGFTPLSPKKAEDYKSM